MADEQSIENDPEYIFTFQFFFPIQNGDPPVSHQDMTTLARLAIAVVISNKRFFLGVEQQMPPSRPPPASRQAMQDLEKITCLSEKRRCKHKLCSICQEDFPTLQSLEDYARRKLNQEPLEEREALIYDKVARMPCRHIYHQTCLEKWLETTGTCPTCRYETGSEEFDSGIRARMKDRDIRLAAELDTDDEGEPTPRPLKRKSPNVEHSMMTRSKSRRL